MVRWWCGNPFRYHDPWSIVGYWSFDEGSGATSTDLSGNGNDGTISGASWTNGKVGGALEFDGENDYVQATVSQDTTTVCLWVQNNGVWEHVVNNNGTYYVNGIEGATPTSYPIYFSGDTVQIGKSDNTSNAL